MDKKKRVLTTVEQVGDTSGFQDGPMAFTKGRVATLITSIVGLVALILIVVFMFTSPKQVTFIYNDLNMKQESYSINMKTGILEECPKDPSKSYYTFDGWYLNSSLSNPSKGMKYSDIKNYKFSKIKNTSVYCKWSPITYNITYDIVGNLSTNQATLSKIVTNNNVTTYTINHEPTQAECGDYVELLRASNPTKYVTSPSASQNVTAALNQYEEDCKLSSYNLKNLTSSSSKYVFIKWVDDDGNEIKQIDKTNPKDITVHAVWEKR